MFTKTVWIFWLLSALFRGSISFCLGYYVVFLDALGMSASQIMLPNMVYWAIKCCADIPNGVLADLFGRKRLFIVGCFIMAGGTSLYAVSTTLGWFVVAEALIAIGSTCESGAFDAWFNAHYERELQVPRAEYARSLAAINNYRELICNGVAIVAASVGAYSSVLGIGTPFVLCSALFCITALVSSIVMYDPGEVCTEHAQFDRNKVRLFWSTLRRASRFCRQGRIVAASCFGIILVVAMQPANMYWALVLRGAGLDKRWMGAAFAVIIVASSIGTYAAKVVSDRYLPMRWFGVTGGLTLVALISAGSASRSGLVVLCFLVHELGRGMFGSNRRAYLGSLAQAEPSAVQATILSIDSTLQSGAAVTGLAIGYLIVDTVGAQGTWVYMGGSCLAALIAWHSVFGWGAGETKVVEVA